jgi:pyrimidine operon attenuation protein/uracil phosphoribosyltransferase
MKDRVILTDDDVRRKINRIAYQIYEAFISEKEVYIVGIESSGYKIASMIAERVKGVSPLGVHLCSLSMDKKCLTAPVALSVSLEEMRDKCVVLVDGVLNSGGVLIYAVRYLLSENIRLLKTAVLVDRNHKRYPIKVDYKGLSLSTGLHESVKIHWREDDTISVEYVL